MRMTTPIFDNRVKLSSTKREKTFNVTLDVKKTRPARQAKIQQERSDDGAGGAPRIAPITQGWETARKEPREPFKPEITLWLERPALPREHLFNLKFAAKELNRNSKKCDKEEKAEKAKIKKAIQKGNMEVARIHAENAIRQKNQAINFLRMSARVDAVAARVQTAVTMGKVTKSMAGVVKSMDATLKSMNLEKISALMDKFEHQFETLDVQTQQMEDTMSNTTTLTTPQNQVDMLLQEMADEAGLDLNMELPQGQTGSVGTSVASAEQDELSQRLARLRDQV
ncbi:charged multivesicular body protein 1b [Athene cunicularia]|uniref:charged multivesicular body protein 1b n=1 Tax=Athene cunicularia TaxID=194338 RepID=UPI000EF6AC6E|nr:charged multivesicular body protein 1b [Athene cunicularia]